MAKLKMISIAVALWAAACNAHVNAFQASPRHICPGQQVELRWDVTGSATLALTPKVAGAPQGAVASSGQVILKPTQNTRASIRVTRWLGEPAGSDIDIQMPAPVLVTADLNDSFSCQANVMSLKTQMKNFSPEVKAEVVGVSIPDGQGRELDISRADAQGKTLTAHVGPGLSSTAFADLPIEGEWILSTKLSGDESCDHPPHVLTVYAYAGCTGGAP
jgi:hypothetical protein